MGEEGRSVTPTEILLEVDRRASNALATGFGAFVSALLRKRPDLEHYWARGRVEKSAQATCRGASLYRHYWRSKRRHDKLEPDNNYRCGKCRACLSQLLGVKEAEAQIKQAFVEADAGRVFDDLLDVLLGRVLHGTIR